MQIKTKFLLKWYEKNFYINRKPSGDKLASTIISRLKLENPEIEYLSVGGTHLKNLGIKSIYNLKKSHI